MNFGDADLIVGAGKAIGIAQENGENPVYAMFLADLTAKTDSLKTMPSERRGRRRCRR
jgi:hypothetical protein